MRKEQHKRQSQHPLVAVDLSSSGLRVMAAHKNDDNTLTILGVESGKRSRAFEKGIITNNTTVGGELMNLLRLLRNRIQMPSTEEIEFAFVSIGGYKLQSTHVPVRRDLIVPTAVAPNRLQEMEQECRTKIEDKYPELKVIAIEPIRYLLDQGEQTEPPAAHQKTRFITIEYDVFVCQRNAFEKLTGAFDRANTGMEAHFSLPNALVTALCNESDMEQGVAIIDLGHQTTTLTIYKGSAFQLTYVVPLGGYHITRDIQDMQISEDYAEAIKVRYGNAMECAVGRNQVMNIPSADNPTQKVALSTTWLAHIIEARLEEIIEPIMQRIRTFTEDEPLEKIYLTGGGAMLQNIVSFVQQYTTISVEYGSHADWLEESADDVYYEPQYAALIGTLILGADYREIHKDEVPKKRPFISKWFETVQQTTIDIFTDNPTKL